MGILRWVSQAFCGNKQDSVSSIYSQILQNVQFVTMFRKICKLLNIDEITLGNMPVPTEIASDCLQNAILS